jgi:hypothetical protein
MNAAGMDMHKYCVWPPQKDKTQYPIQGHAQDTTRE